MAPSMCKRFAVRLGDERGERLWARLRPSIEAKR
jgi:hypothetical protein